VARPVRPGTRVLAGLLVGLAAWAACGGRGDPGGLGEPGPAPPPPDLTGVRVMLLPARTTAPGQLDEELEHWLTGRAEATDWVLPAELQAAADRSPNWRLRLDAMPRLITGTRRSDLRIRDPLYGNLRRLGAIIDANYAFMPVAWGEAADSLGVVGLLTAAIVDVRGGRVVWLHTVRGEPSATADAAVASTAEALARTLIPLEG
jgi:hypothetical protein